VACDACGAGGWIDRAGTARGGTAKPAGAWCEGCQSAHRVDAGDHGAPPCPRCGTTLTLGEPRFEELLGEARNIAAVLSAWCGDAAPLATLLPDRPRFLTDLDPPAPRAGDAPGARAGLEALARGQFARARELLSRTLTPSGAASHVWRGLGVAAQRLGDDTLAEGAFTRAVEAEPHDTVSRLNRGALRARRGDFAAARQDFDLAGDRREACWDRAALRVLERVATTPGLPDPETLRRAREEAGEPSPYWSDHTVGRLLWTLLVERAVARADDEGRVIRAAERELEFDTFWDRALVVHGYARLGMKRDAGEAAAGLAGGLLARLREEPFARGPAGAWLESTLARTADAIREGRPGDARAALGDVLERPDVGRYRVPCAACGRGSIGVEAYEDTGAGP
jgi:tetratricopeptide (TPR) repeat protein